MFVSRHFLLLAFALFGALPAHAKVNVTGNKLKLNAFTLYEMISNEITDMEAGGAKINLPSCYRSTAEQAKICSDMGCPGGCPGRCAPPGRSNHQHYPTCDWSGIPGDVKRGCELLLKVCNKIKAKSEGVGCEIGGYGSGAHHLAAGPGVKNTAYNQCKYLKDQVQKDPPKEPADKLKDDGDKEYNDVMNNNGQNPAQQAAQQAAQALAKASPPASYPRDARGASWADSPHGATSPTPETNPRGTTSKAGDAFGDGGTRKVGDPSFGPGHDNPHSSITKRGFDKLPDFAGGYDRGAATGSARGGAGGFGGDGASRGGPSTGFGGTKVGGGGVRATTNEALSSFRNPSLPSASGAGGGGSSGGGRGGAGSGGTSGAAGAGIPSIAGAETDAAVKGYMSEFTQMGARVPASGQGSGDEIGAAESDSIFQRVHAAHRRCIQGGCVTAH